MPPSFRPLQVDRFVINTPGDQFLRCLVVTFELGAARGHIIQIFLDFSVPLAMYFLPTVGVLVIWVVWKAYRSLYLSPLDNIAGPPSDSFVKGKPSF